jgi:hypothetical protein
MKQSPQQINETTKEKKCKRTFIGTIYVVIGPGKLHPHPYVRYVGQTTDNNLNHYLKNNMNKTKNEKRPFIIWLKEQSSNSDKIKIIPIAEMNKTDLDQQEILWIAYWRSIYTDLLNVTHGGSCGRGYKMPPKTIEKLRNRMIGNKYAKGRKHTEEEKRRIGEKSKGYKHTEEAKRRMSEINKGKHKGKHLSEENKLKIKIYMNRPETKEKISKLVKGRKHSNETIQKLRQINSGKNNPNYKKSGI